MSKEQKDPHLRFGQGILIEGFKADGNDQGLLTAQGFADATAKYETYDDILFFKNYRNSLFQILPAGNFQLNDELGIALIQNEGQADTPNIKILKSRAESQKVQFNLNIDNKMKEQVCFGHSVIFKHIDSGSYVSGTIKPSNGSSGAFTVQVSEKLSESLVFKLEPYRSFQFMDMPIPFDSPIKIMNLFNGGYLTFEKMGVIDPNKDKNTYIAKKPIQSNDSYKIPVKTPSMQSQSYEIVTHFVDLSCEKEAPMPWRFKLHVRDVINDTLIQHDVVYLNHSQRYEYYKPFSGGVLATYKGEIVLKEQKQKTSDELCFYECLWEIEKHDATENAYILRHLMSGMILGVASDSEYSKPILIDISEGKEKAHLGYVDIRMAKKQNGSINSDSFINVLHGDDLILQVDESQALEESVRKVEGQGQPQLVDTIKMSNLYKKQIDYNIKKMMFRKNVSQKHCFVIMEIVEDLKLQLLFALSFHSVIIKLKADLQWGAIEAAKKIDYLRMMRVTEKIKQIKRFVKNCSEEEAEMNHFLPLTKRQMICKDLGISELLFQLLYYMRMNLKEDIFSDKHNEHDKFLELYNSLYEVIRELVRNNAQFKMHVSKWFQFILTDVIQNNQPSQLMLLKELLIQNQFFVNNFVTTELIKHLTNSCLSKNSNNQFIEKKYLQILRLFCIVGSTVNTANQELVLKWFITALKQNGSVFDVKILIGKASRQGDNVKQMKPEEQICVRFALDKNKKESLAFKDFYAQCMEKYSSAWEYFVQYLNLIADLAQGRNKITQKVLCQSFTKQILADLFQKEDLQQSQVPIIRLIHYLYAESEDFYPIQRQRKILNYHELGNPEFSVLCTREKQKLWETPFDRIWNCLISRIKHFESINPSQIQSNKRLEVLLKFLWETVRLGFWSSKEQVKEILEIIQIILQKHPSIDAENYDLVKAESQENILMIRCKLECLSIIELIADIDCDSFVQIIADKFKSYQIPKKTFSLKGAFESNNLFEIKCNHSLVNNFMYILPPEEEIQPIIETSIVNLMIEVSNYGNSTLTSKAISIIDRVFQTRKKAFQQFYELIIISEEERLKLLEFMEEHRNKFFILEDPNIIGVSPDNQSCNYFMVYNEKGAYGIMEVLYLLTQLMKNENSILSIENIKSIHQSGIFDSLGSAKLINFTGERSSTNRMKQEIVYSSNLHLKVLTYIFNCKDFPETVLANKLLHMCYYFIVSLIENFNQIKAIMQWHVPKLIQHIKRNVGCIDFLKQMYDNNKTMLYNDAVVNELIKEICEDIESENGQESFYKSKLLDFFRYLIYCNGKSLKNNQIQILKIMQDDSYKNIMIKTSPEEILALVKDYEDENDFENVDKSIKMSPQLTYLCTFFQILSSLIDFKNVVNIGKLIKKYPFDMLSQCLKNCGKCWPLKRNIRTFLNRLYYFRAGIETQLKTIIGQEMENLVQDLNLFIEQKIEVSSSAKEQLKFQNPVRFTYLESYFYLLIQQSLFTIFQLFTRKNVSQQIIGYLNRMSPDDNPDYKIVKITERLAWMQNYFRQNNNTYTNSLIKYIVFRIKNFFQKISEHALFQTGYPVKIQKIVKEIREKKKNIKQNTKQNSKENAKENEKEQKLNTEIGHAKKFLINKIFTQSITSFYHDKSKAIRGDLPLTYLIEDKEKPLKQEKKSDPNKLKQALQKIFERQKRDFKNQDQKISYDLQQLISSIKLSPKTQNYFFEEYLSKASPYSTSGGIFEYIGRIIQMNSQSSSALGPHLKIFFLNMITEKIKQTKRQDQERQKSAELKQQAVEQKSQDKLEQNRQEEQKSQGEETAKQIDEWDAQDWADNRIEIEQVQKKLKDCGLGLFLAQILKEDIINNIELANATLLCAISFLLGGNTVTQKNIIQEISSDDQNKVFENIQSLIVKLGKLIRKNIDESTVKEEEVDPEFNPNTIDNYDYYDVSKKYTQRKNVYQPNSTDQYLYSKLCITTYRRAFKFLQLLCENNNKENKHFIREQPGKPRQFNFINITTKELRNLFHIYCLDIKEVPLFLLDFLLEVTQIPIKQNQNALLNSSFFQDLCQLGAYFQGGEKSLKNYEDRGFKQAEDRQFVMDIYFKSFKIVLSNFQGNNVEIFSLLDNKLDPKFLTNVLTEYLNNNGLTNREELIQSIGNWSNETIPNEQGVPSKRTDFSEQILNVLDIITIELKLRDSLHEKSRIFNHYSKFKKEIEDKYKQKFADKAPQDVEENGEVQRVEEQMKDYKCMYGYLEKQLLSIEISDDNLKDQVIYFPKYPVFASLSSNLRDYIMKQVERGSQRDKIVSLLGYTDAIKEKIEYSYNLKKIQNINQSNMSNSFSWAMNFSFIVCLYIGVFYHVIIEYGNAEYISYFPIGIVRFILSLIQLTFTLFYVYYWYKLNIWFNPQRKSRSSSKNQTDQKEDEAAEAPAPEQYPVVPAPPTLFTSLFQKIYFYWAKITVIIDFLLEELSTEDQRLYKSLQFWRIVIFTGASIIGTFYFPPIFFIHLIDWFAQMEDLGRILQSVVYASKSLFYVSVMGVFFTFIFCTVTFSNYMKNVYSQGQSVNEMCQTVLDCVLSLYVSGAIGQTMETFEIMRFIYDIIYITFFSLLFGNIVAGLMIDAFGSLREKDEQLKSDKKDMCYICNITRDKLEKNGEKFDTHTKTKHFLWNYIFYIYTLERKDETDYTGLEYHISQMYNLPDQEMKIQWLPSKGQNQFDIQEAATELNGLIDEQMEAGKDKWTAMQDSIAQFNKIAEGFQQE